MKNKILIIFFVILGLFIINIFSINSFYNNFEGKKLYENKDFSGSLNYFKANKDYIGLYNIGNIYYKLGEKSLPLQGGDLEGVIKLWKKSLEYYKNSMQIKYTKESEENYNFVSKKLDELLNKQKEQNPPLTPPSKGGGKDNKDGKKSENKQEDKKGNSGENKEENSNNQQDGFSPLQEEQKGGTQGSPLQNNKENKPQLSSQTKQQLKAYEEQLKREQKANAKNFGKVYKEQENPFDNFDDFFGGDPFFDNSILDRGQEKKDW